jgi:hypothetical protein
MESIRSQVQNNSKKGPSIELSLSFRYGDLLDEPGELVGFVLGEVLKGLLGVDLEAAAVGIGNGSPAPGSEYRPF